MYSPLSAIESGLLFTQSAVCVLYIQSPFLFLFFQIFLFFSFQSYKYFTHFFLSLLLGPGLHLSLSLVVFIAITIHLCLVTSILTLFPKYLLPVFPFVFLTSLHLSSSLLSSSYFSPAGDQQQSMDATLLHLLPLDCQFLRPQYVCGCGGGELPQVSPAPGGGGGQAP